MNDLNDGKLQPPRSRPALVSVVLPVRNGAGTLAEQLKALSSQSYLGQWELVVADNGSTDSTRAVCHAWTDRLPRVRVVDASDGVGPSHARNVGASEASGELLAFCDADDVVDTDWLEQLVDTALTYDVVGGVQEASLLNDRSVQTSRGTRATRALGRPLRFLPFAPTNNLAVWANVFGAVGGMNPSYRAGEDIEFSWRAQLSGYSLGFAPHAIVHYRYRDTVSDVARQAFQSGIASVRLVQDFRRAGVRAPAIRLVLRRWAVMLLRLPFLAMPTRRLSSVRLIATNAGKLAASIKLRIFCP